MENMDLIILILIAITIMYTIMVILLIKQLKEEGEK